MTPFYQKNSLIYSMLSIIFQRYPVQYYKLLLLVIGLNLITEKGVSQKKALLASTKIVKVGYLEPSRVRNDFSKFTKAKEKLTHENKTNKYSYDSAVQELDKRILDKLIKDSLTGGKEKNKILDEGNTQRSNLEKQYKQSQRLLNSKRIALTQKFEGEINEAISLVISENGLTDVQAFQKDTLGNRKLNITDLVLKKLN